jgi:required for meiotic nuclear division protein 1
MDMTETLSVRALLLGERLETRGLERDDTLATNPFTLRVGRQGTAFLFRYGVAVFARLSAIEEDDILRSLRARVHDPLETPETDQIQVRVNPAGEDQIEPSGAVSPAEASLERLQIIASVVLKSLVLGHSERVSPMSSTASNRSRWDCSARDDLAPRRKSCCSRSAMFC